MIIFTFFQIRLFPFCHNNNHIGIVTTHFQIEWSCGSKVKWKHNMNLLKCTAEEDYNYALWRGLISQLRKCLKWLATEWVNPRPSFGMEISFLSSLFNRQLSPSQAQSIPNLQRNAMSPPFSSTHVTGVRQTENLLNWLHSWTPEICMHVINEDGLKRK